MSNRGKSRQAQSFATWLYGGSNKKDKLGKNSEICLQNQRIALLEASLENAGVGGATPLLATFLMSLVAQTEVFHPR